MRRIDISKEIVYIVMIEHFRGRGHLMQMSEILDKLKNLQDVLAEKYEIEEKRKELPKSVSGSKELLERTQKEFIEKNAEYEAEKSKVSALKLELDEAVKSRETGEKNMDSIKTHREYEVLEKQISEAKEREDSLRKDLQKEEKLRDELQDTLKGIEGLIETTKKDVEESEESLSKEMAAYDSQLSELGAKEAEMSEGIDSETIFKFQRIIQRNRKGIVAVKGNVCDGCHMILPAQFANEVHRGEKILFCPYCSRILYYEDSVEGKTDFYAMNDTGNLADFDEDDADLYDDGDLLGEEGIDELDADSSDSLKSGEQYE